MFWDKVAGVYDIFANIINKKTHKKLKAVVANEICESDNVCKPGGKIIIPTYMNKDNSGKTSGFAKTVGKAGADFKRQFTLETYKDFFKELGYSDAEFVMCEGRIPCAVAVIHLRKDK